MHTKFLFSNIVELIIFIIFQYIYIVLSLVLSKTLNWKLYYINSYSEYVFKKLM